MELYDVSPSDLEALKQLQNVYTRIKPGATIDDVRKKINSLRSNYRRELRKIEASKNSGASDSDVYKPRVWSFQYLYFLKNTEHPDHLVPKANIKIKSEDLSQSELGENSSSSESEIVQSPTEYNNSQHFFSQKTITSPAPKVRRVTKVESLNIATDPLDVTSSKLSLPQRIITQPKPLHTHCCTLASLWIEKLERLDPVQKLFAEKAINDILFEAELGNLNRNSVKINEPPAAGIVMSSSPSSSQQI